VNTITREALEVGADAIGLSPTTLGGEHAKQNRPCDVQEMDSVVDLHITR